MTNNPMKELKYAAILKENQRLGEALKEERPYRIAVLSNVTVNQIQGNPGVFTPAKQH